MVLQPVQSAPEHLILTEMSSGRFTQIANVVLVGLPALENIVGDGELEGLRSRFTEHSEMLRVLLSQLTHNPILPAVTTSTGADPWGRPRFDVDAMGRHRASRPRLTSVN
jgi:hypothetical protein